MFVSLLEFLEDVRIESLNEVFRPPELEGNHDPQVTFAVEDLENPIEQDEEESPWEGSGSAVSRIEELEGRDPARRD